jgi:NAD(P)-dependent dehydrogenase (short-subunit alcohol dehydrogenase family)
MRIIEQKARVLRRSGCSFASVSVPLGRVGQPQEIAGLVAYLASEESAHMIGDSVTMDGGYVL